MRFVRFTLLVALGLGAGFGAGACKDRTAAPPAESAVDAEPATGAAAAARAAVEGLSAADPASVKAVVAVAAEARPVLRTLLEEGDAARVNDALAAYVGSHGQLPPGDLQAALEREEPAIRKAALEAAGAIGAGELFALVEARLVDRDAAVRHAAVAALGQLSDPRVQPRLLTLLQQVGGPDAALGEAAARALGGKRGLGRTAPFLALLKHEQPTVRRRAVTVLGGRAEPGTLQAVAPLVNDPDPSVQRAALEALARYGSGPALEPIRPLVSDADVARRRTAVDLLRHFDPSDVRSLVWQALDDADPKVRQIATAALARYDGNPALDEALRRKLADPAGMVRVAAVSAAQGTKRTPGVERMLLDRVALESDPAVFTALGRAFRARRLEGEGFRALVGALASAEGVAAEGAAEGLKALTGQDFGQDAWAWRNWAAEQTQRAAGAGAAPVSPAGGADAGSSGGAAPAPAPAGGADAGASGGAAPTPAGGADAGASGGAAPAPAGGADAGAP